MDYLFQQPFAKYEVATALQGSNNLTKVIEKNIFQNPK